MLARGDLEAARAAGIIDQPTLDRLIGFLAGRPPAAPALAEPAAPPAKFDLAHLLWYAGALVIIGSMGLFTTVAFNLMGGRALVATALVYAVAFVVGGHILWHRRDLPVPGGLLIACAVAMAPLATFGVQEWLGWWAGDVRPGTMREFYIWIKGGWVPMELVTLAAALMALWFYPFPFIVAVASVALWFLTMDLGMLLAEHWRGESVSGWDIRRRVSQWFGLAIILFAWLVDLRKRSGDFAFWLHLVGVVVFWGAVTSSPSSDELGKLLYFVLNVGMVGLSLFLGRRVYAVFGAFGIMFYLGHLAQRVFQDSLLFPFALSGLGLLLIWLGIVYVRRRAEIERGLAAAMPPWLAALRPVHARV